MHERWIRYWLRSIIIVADSIISPITSGWIILLQFWMNFMHSFFIQGLGHIPCIQCSNGQKRNAICWQPFSEMYSRKKKKTIENHLAHQWGTRMECISRGRCAFFLWQKLQIANCTIGNTWKFDDGFIFSSTLFFPYEMFVYEECLLEKFLVQSIYLFHLILNHVYP